MPSRRHRRWPDPTEPTATQARPRPTSDTPTTDRALPATPIRPAPPQDQLSDSEINWRLRGASLLCRLLVHLQLPENAGVLQRLLEPKLPLIDPTGQQGTAPRANAETPALMRANAHLLMRANAHLPVDTFGGPPAPNLS